jgi:hypothetical protein
MVFTGSSDADSASLTWRSFTRAQPLAGGEARPGLHVAREAAGGHVDMRRRDLQRQLLGGAALREHQRPTQARIVERDQLHRLGRRASIRAGAAASAHPRCRAARSASGAPRAPRFISGKWPFGPAGGTEAAILDHELVEAPAHARVAAGQRAAQPPRGGRSAVVPAVLSRRAARRRCNSSTATSTAGSARRAFTTGASSDTAWVRVVSENRPDAGGRPTPRKAHREVRTSARFCTPPSTSTGLSSRLAQVMRKSSRPARRLAARAMSATANRPAGMQWSKRRKPMSRRAVGRLGMNGDDFVVSSHFLPIASRPQ